MRSGLGLAHAIPRIQWNRAPLSNQGEPDMDDVRQTDRDIGGHRFEDLRIGMTASFAKTVTDADIVLFAGISGDTNPLHIDQDYARQTSFGGRIAHGMLTAGFISCVLGTRLPGPGCVYLSQTLKFRAPVRVGDTVTTRATVAELFPDKKRALIRTVCSIGDTVVLEGEALLMVPSHA